MKTLDDGDGIELFTIILATIFAVPLIAILATVSFMKLAPDNAFAAQNCSLNSFYGTVRVNGVATDNALVTLTDITNNSSLSGVTSLGGMYLIESGNLGICATANDRIQITASFNGSSTGVVVPYLPVALTKIDLSIISTTPVPALENSVNPTVALGSREPVTERRTGNDTHTKTYYSSGILYEGLNLQKTVGNSTIIFNDIADSFARDDIALLAQKGVVRGYSDGTFKPNKPVTRAEFLAMTLKDFEIPVDLLSKTSSFTDIPTDASWIVPYVTKAQELGIIKGQIIDGKLRFRPNDPISRAEALAILLVAGKFNIDTSVQKSEFTDIPPDAPWMVPYIQTAKTYSIVNGQIIDGKLRFRPNDPISRAESAKVITQGYGISYDLQSKGTRTSLSPRTN